MSTVLSALKSLTNLPIPLRTFEALAVVRGIDLDVAFTTIIATSEAYNLMVADIYMWVSNAANVSEGGVSFNLSQTERISLKKRAISIYTNFGNADATTETQTYGYMGTDL